MSDTIGHHGRKLQMNLGFGAVLLKFSDRALLTSFHVNFYKSKRIVLHVKYLPMQGGFVLNDMRGDAWGEETFIECLRIPGAAALTVRLSKNEYGGLAEIPGLASVGLGERFDLDGELTVEIPSGVHCMVSSEETVAEGNDPERPLEITHLEAADSIDVQIGCDAVVTSGSAFFIEGWVDDRHSPLAGLQLLDYATGERVRLIMGRLHRQDVDAHLGVSKPAEFGFWAVGLGGPERLGKGCLSLVFEDGSALALEPQKVIRQDVETFFATALSSFGRRSVLGNLTARSFADLSAGYGIILRKLYRQLGAQRRITVSVQFGKRTMPRVSLICVLYGIADFLYLLVAQFARFGTLDSIEFIFVSNSPELEEVLLKDAELAAFVFAANVRFIGLNQNTGFSYANNAGVAEARARTIAIINPDVFPRHTAALRRLLALGDEPLGDDIVGGRLYYSDGSVMHEGMAFRLDQALSAICKTYVWAVEHSRKGFPDTGGSDPFVVPAVTGALMVFEKALFERLEGFSTAYIFGHYEDADLCLRAQQVGSQIFVDPTLAYWH